MRFFSKVDPRNYHWSKLSGSSRLLIVTLYALIMSSVFSLAFEIVDIDQVVYRNVFLSAVGVASLYIAYIRYFVKHQNSVQTYVSRGPIEDGKVNRINISVVNQGQNPVTLMHVPVIWINITGEEMKISYHMNRRTKPISSASKEGLQVDEEAYYYKVLKPYLKDKLGENLRSDLSGVPETTTVDHLTAGNDSDVEINREEIQDLAEEVSKRLEVKISQKSISYNSMSWSLSLNNFKKLSTSQIVDNLMSDRVLMGEISLDDMLYQQLTLKDLNQDWEPVKDTEDDVADGYTKVRITSDVPEFMGTDLEQYGPYSEGDKAEVPDDNAEILINRNNAEKVD